MKVVTLHKTNFRDAVSAIRKIADEIEAGKYGDVETVAVALTGDRRLSVFGAGPHSEVQTVALVLHAGFMRLSDAIYHSEP